MKYTEEKAIYFASQEKCLHVCFSEQSRNTDLWRIVKQAEKQGFLIRLAGDDSGHYFGITKIGALRLLELQIEWREKNGKDASEKRKELYQLRAA